MDELNTALTTYGHQYVASTGVSEAQVACKQLGYSPYGQLF